MGHEGGLEVRNGAESEVRDTRRADARSARGGGCKEGQRCRTQERAGSRGVGYRGARGAGEDEKIYLELASLVRGRPIKYIAHLQENRPNRPMTNRSSGACGALTCLCYVLLKF